MSERKKTFNSLKKFRGVRPYKANGRSNLGFTNKKTGVYIIREKKRGGKYQTVYVGHSTADLYKTITRHFQEWNDRQQPQRVSYKQFIPFRKYIVQVAFCHPKQALPLEAGLIDKLKPRDNTTQMEFNLSERARELAKGLFEAPTDPKPLPEDQAPF